MYYNNKRLYECQCRNCGTVFDYRNRIKYHNNYGYAPCQGVCPNCMSEKISLVDETIYLIKWKFTDSDIDKYHQKKDCRNKHRNR